MKDSFLVKLSLFVSLVGLVFIFLVINFSSLQITSLPDVKDSNEDYIKTIGLVENVNINDKITLLTISSKNLLDILIFENVSLKEGQLVVIEGQLKEYKGKNEIIANQVSLYDDK